MSSQNLVSASATTENNGLMSALSGSAAPRALGDRHLMVFNSGWPGVVTIAASVNPAGTMGANAGVAVTGYSLLNLSFRTNTANNNVLITSNANSGTGVVLTSAQANMLIQAPERRKAALRQR